VLGEYREGIVNKRPWITLLMVVLIVVVSLAMIGLTPRAEARPGWGPTPTREWNRPIPPPPDCWATPNPGWEWVCPRFDVRHWKWECVICLPPG
jgi:hypothetical protein